MTFMLKGGSVYSQSGFVQKDIAIENNRVLDISPNCLSIPLGKADCFLDCDGLFIFPGFVDVHTHLREPGFFYKETIKTGTMAAAHGGYTQIFSMPNVMPVPDNIENLKIQTDIIERDAIIDVFPYGAITVGEMGEKLSDMSALADRVIAFSDDGRGVQNEELMLEAMLEAKRLNKIIVAHCEDINLVDGGYIHDGKYARLHGHKGNPSSSEYAPVIRDLKLVEKSGASYHVCHVSTAESVEAIRQAKRAGLDVTCETAPHYLTLTDMDLKEAGDFKMNPPLRSEHDKIALIEGINDGTIDMIATDHAPHSEGEKSKGLIGSLNGIVGLETAFSVLYTSLVKQKIITLERLIELMCVNPRKRFGLNQNFLSDKDNADITVFDLNSKYVIDKKDFLSRGKASPFIGREVYGKNVMTIHNGRIVWQDLTKK